MVRSSKLALDPSTGRLMETDLREIPRTSIANCPFAIFGSQHYRDDGTCKCNDPDERVMLMRDWGYAPVDFERVGIAVGAVERAKGRRGRKR